MFDKYIVMGLLLLGEFGKFFGVLGIWNGRFCILDSVIGYFHISSETFLPVYLYLYLWYL